MSIILSNPFFEAIDSNNIDVFNQIQSISFNKSSQFLVDNVTIRRTNVRLGSILY